MFHADGQTDGKTDMTKLIVAFRNFANAPKNEMGRERSMWHVWGERRCTLCFDGETFGKKTLGRTGSRWENNIKVYLQEKW